MTNTERQEKSAREKGKKCDSLCDKRVKSCGFDRPET
jgi:hypothetical protein